MSEVSEEDDDLDPVALNKAFRFAAWSSLALVRILIHECSTTDLSVDFSASRLDYYHPISAFLCPNDLRSRWAHRVGGHWHYLDIHVCHYRRDISSMGEPSRSESDIPRNG